MRGNCLTEQAGRRAVLPAKAITFGERRKAEVMSDEFAGAKSDVAVALGANEI